MKLFGVITAGLLLPGALTAQEALSVNRDSAWFKPSLEVDLAPVCADVLRVEQNAFFSTATANHERPGFKLIRKMYEDAVADPQVESLPESVGHLRLTLPGQQRAIVYFHKNGGCGGACETEQVMVADKVFDPVPSRGHGLPATPPAAGWTLYKSSDGEFYALGQYEGKLQTYRVAPSLRMELACEVQMRPADSVGNDDPSVRKASASAAAFLSALGSMSRGAGSCGSLNAHWIRRQKAMEAMDQALYRPWASGASRRGPDELLGNADSLSQGNSAIDHDLAKWALSGVAEHRAFNEYRRQFERTAADLSRFYREKFGWSEAAAGDAAIRVLQAVLERAFAFSSSFDRFGRGQPLRQAILERRPIDEIDELYQAQAREAEPPDAFQEASQYDSVLNAAIEYPEALQYLLGRGLDPNVTNGFGKTPLMYAAQHDQLESARILLRAGADPNAATYPPEDTCFYTLASRNVTALHYAARYASAPLIQLLVANGAATFSKAQRGDSSAEEYPLDWLNTFAGIAPVKEEPIHAVIPPEKNPKLASADLPALQQLLRIPGDKEREQISASFLARAQEQYSRGEFKPAYRQLQTALSAQPDNVRALADMPLMAFKAGNIGEALGAAKKGIEAAGSPQLQAAAWFNMGLICESAEIRSQFFSGGRCDRDWIWPFVQALKMQPTRGRADKLIQLFDRKEAGSCSPASGPDDRKFWSTSAGLYQRDRVERFYILHSAAEKINVAPAPGISRVVDGLPVRDRALTVLEGPPRSAPPGIDGQACRMPNAPGG